MTDRIKALGLQASALALEEYRTRQKTEFAGDVIYSDIYDRKFTELVVRECVACCGSQADKNNLLRHFNLEP
jgi:hypothetical protein